MARFDRTVLPITTALATVFLTGCERGDAAATDLKVCRDSAGRRVDDDNCQRSGGWHGSSFMWVGINRGDRVPRMGEGVDPSPLKPGVRYASAIGRNVVRGGFGSFGRSSGRS